ncbi:hypothetical protein [Natrialba swarupiae]|uniref:Twin-arginine translocation signal domain-containing protein n=1 Tax=Natrialba swarupiae TaxID=2448032 RepID=A0A5D5AQ37_9EURY|nr:hypothetical protein [Natrialba swarupiae]TYT61570.1 hypothetical protein FYC77_12840 [Natrialba swarupiae]
MTNLHDRRRVLQIAGAGAIASVAGCSDLDSSESVESEPGADGSGDQQDAHGSDDEQGDVLTAIAEPEMDDMQELQEEVMTGELSQEEAMQRQNELHEEAIDEFETRVDSEDDTDLRIEETEDGSGLYLVDGSADVLVDALRSGDISVLGQTGLYDQILQQQQQQQPEGEEIDEDQLEEIEEQLEEQASEDDE